MADDFKTIFTDDDGDGIYDDVHVVNTMEENYDYSFTYRPYKESPVSFSKITFLSARTKRKIALAMFLFFFGIANIVGIGAFILSLFVR